MTPNKKASKKVIPAIESLTCIDSAEGMARRVLFDLEYSGLSMQKLAVAYKHDYQDGGYQYPNLIRLGLYKRSNIAANCHVSESTVARALRTLRAKGLLAIKSRFDEDGRQTSNNYILIDNPQLFLGYRLDSTRCLVLLWIALSQNSDVLRRNL